MIPVKYNVRNLGVRWVTTLMTVLVTGLVVWATVLTFGLIDGLEHALRISGEPLDLIVMRKGSKQETSSSVTQQQAREHRESRRDRSRCRRRTDVFRRIRDDPHQAAPQQRRNDQSYYSWLAAEWSRLAS